MATNVIPIRTRTAPETIRLDLGPPRPSLACIAGIVGMQVGLRLWEIQGEKRSVKVEAAHGTIAWLAACCGHSPDQLGDYLRRDPGEAAALVVGRDRLILKSPEIADKMIGLVALVEAACP
jgi:hypothetical protein